MAPTCYARSVIIKKKKNSALELSWEFIESALLVGEGGQLAFLLLFEGDSTKKKAATAKGFFFLSLSLSFSPLFFGQVSRLSVVKVYCSAPQKKRGRAVWTRGSQPVGGNPKKWGPKDLLKVGRKKKREDVCADRGVSNLWAATTKSGCTGKRGQLCTRSGGFPTCGSQAV